MKVISVILIHICANFGIWADETDKNKNSLETYLTTSGVVIPNSDASVYTINDVIFRPAFLVKILRRKNSSNSVAQSFNTLQNINVYPDSEDVGDNHRLVRSVSVVETPQTSNEDSQDDLSLAESSIPFHPLFAIRHRKEVKRRYGYRRY